MHLKVAIAPDDTIWTLGYVLINRSANDLAVNQEAKVLRHFDRAGTLIGSAFPQSQFNRRDRFAITNGLLVAAQDWLGWYGTVSGKTKYREISLEPMTMREYPGAPSDPAKSVHAIRLAIASSDAIAVCIQEGSPGRRTNFVLDRAASRWVPVSVPPMGGFKFTPELIGSDGNSLLFKYGSEAEFYRVA